jgi:5'-nucleotidase
MSIKRTLGIDLDDTLNNLCEVWIERYNKDYNDNITSFNDWDCTKCVKQECGEKIYDYLSEPQFFYNTNIKENAFEVINFLLEYFDIYIVTAYRSKTCLDKTNWIKKHLPNINPENIIFCNNKGLLNLDFLIDDAAHNIKAFKQQAIVYNHPHNLSLGDNDGFNDYIRVNNWLEIKELFTNKFI